MSTDRSTRLIGREAIEHAERRCLKLHKYADPIEEARDDLTPTEAKAIASEDPSLIWILVRAGRKRR